MKASNWRGFGLGGAVLVAALATSAPAAATTYRDLSAGAVCHPANGALASKFTYNLQYLTNIGTTDAYVICSLETSNTSNPAGPPALLRFHAQTTNVGSIVTCSAQVGAHFGGISRIYRSSTETYTSVDPDEGFALNWNEVLLDRTISYQLLSVNCKLPPGAKLGLIEFWD